MIQAFAASPSYSVANRVCTHCASGPFRRVNRQGWLQQRVLPSLLGLFPWECVMCRRKKFFRDNGNRPSARGYLRA